MLKPRALAALVISAVAAIFTLSFLEGGEARPRTRAGHPGPRSRLELPAMDVLPDAAPESPRLDAEIEIAPPSPPVAPAGRPAAVEGPATIPDLATAGGWMRSLAVHHALPPLSGPQAELARLGEALEQATNPAARQNIIFLAVLTLPAEVSHPWLRDRMSGGSGGDAEDALLALAFDGDGSARFRFGRLACASSPAPVHRLLDTVHGHERLGESGTDEARDVLRSYRAIEVLDREPYFELTWCNVDCAPWVPHPARTPELDRELLADWLARYPGHPGSDDMALRLGRIETERGAALDAARWYSRAATMPDQDVTEAAVMGLASVAELLLTPEELDVLAHEQGYLTPNRTLVQYIRLRRLAAERGFGIAIRYAEALGRDEPSSVLGYAWTHRYGAPVSRGLDSGVAPLPQDDPLRRVEEPVPAFVRPEGAPPPRRIPGHLGTPEDEARLDPWPERLQIDEKTLMRQFRAWEAIETLELRAARARRHARADLLYKVAAIFYHEPHSVFPAYGEVCDFTGVLRRARQANRPGFGEFVRTSYPLLRAIRIFERIEREDPAYAAIDKVVYSKGVAWARLSSYDFDAQDSGDGPREDYPGPRKVRNAVDALERCAACFPKSPLADDAVRLAAYWRSARPEAFK